MESHACRARRPCSSAPGPVRQMSPGAPPGTHLTPPTTPPPATSRRCVRGPSQLSVTTSCTFLRGTSPSYLRATTSGTAHSLSASDLPHGPRSGRSDHGHYPHASHLRPSVPPSDPRDRRRPTRNPGRYLRGESPSDSTPRTQSPPSSRQRAVGRLGTVRPPSSPTLESRTSTRKSMSSSIPALFGASLR